jgi:hypothetical protein
MGGRANRGIDRTVERILSEEGARTLASPVKTGAGASCVVSVSPAFWQPGRMCYRARSLEAHNHGESGMKTRATVTSSVGAVALAMLAGSGVTLLAQNPKAAQIVPPGFTVTIERTYGPAVVFEATKSNESCPKPHVSPEIAVTGGWQPNPLAAKSVEMMAGGPDDPPSAMGVTRDEPMGKERYRGGVIIWRKATTPWVGSGSGPALVTVSGAWAGAGPGLMLRAGVSRVCGSKETVRGWLDAMIDRLSTVK